MVERKVFASGGKYTRAATGLRFSTAPMKEGFWCEKPLCSWRVQVLVSM